jgi:NAD(P)-dependent dehydrogenase (short-subunit alcohol dehydrogenase family)
VSGAAGRLDVVVQNAGHLYAGYTEAFTAEEVARLLDVNVLGAQRVNRAALPRMRGQGRGTLVWVGSTTTVTIPPFLGPYVVSKAAMDSLAVATAYEVRPSRPPTHGSTRSSPATRKQPAACSGPTDAARESFVKRMGFGQLLDPAS